MTQTPARNLHAAPPAGAVVPERPVLEGLEDTWSQRWREADTYAFVRPQSRAQVFSIDTPPPTVSGKQVFPYTAGRKVIRPHTDIQQDPASGILAGLRKKEGPLGCLKAQG